MKGGVYEYLSSLYPRQGRKRGGGRTLQGAVFLPFQAIVMQKEIIQSKREDSVVVCPWLDGVFDDDNFFEGIMQGEQGGFLLPHFFLVAE